MTPKSDVTCVAERCTPCRSDKAPWQGGFVESQGDKDLTTNCAALAAERKRLATLRAMLALHGGHVVHELPGGAFLVTWHAFSRECRDLAELEAHAHRVGALR